MASDKEWVKISELSEEEKQSLTAGTEVLLHDNYYNGSSDKAALIRKKGSQGKLEGQYYELTGQMVRILFGSRSLKVPSSLLSVPVTIDRKQEVELNLSPVQIVKVVKSLELLLDLDKEEFKFNRDEIALLLGQLSENLDSNGIDPDRVLNELFSRID
ncbi:hypothetical protein RJD11_09610 [Bacillus velezensis]|uniref:hypothetical protein n=1 Tax=Bacillus TaxID=1386 RepID=UPI0003873F85|nr:MULTISPECIES: hypothetical protein [Bacillus]MBU8885943.1 hypothetical protein [Bacillus sp. FJAT-27001]PAK28182.1 hypothetical protein CJ467_21655 [Bacillus velezensis]QPV79357.1 hypothetical protein I8N73_09440 [Bacillus velezensis]QXP98930.1 hypothetical protein KVY05_09535 [Bacillus velezensis]UHH04758.1 hypothetical protein LUA14_09580 [Bacillus amyloliquefaciens]